MFVSSTNELSTQRIFFFLLFRFVWFLVCLGTHTHVQSPSKPHSSHFHTSRWKYKRYNRMAREGTRGDKETQRYEFGGCIKLVELVTIWRNEILPFPKDRTFMTIRTQSKSPNSELALCCSLTMCVCMRSDAPTLSRSMLLVFVVVVALLSRFHSFKCKLRHRFLFEWFYVWSNFFCSNDFLHFSTLCWTQLNTIFRTFLCRPT